MLRSLTVSLCVSLALAISGSAVPTARSASKSTGFSLEDYRGKAWSLEDFRGEQGGRRRLRRHRVPAGGELCGRGWQKLADEYRGGRRGVLAIDANQQDSLAELAHFARTHKIEFPAAQGCRQQGGRQFGAERTPEVFVLDARSQGRLPRPHRRPVHLWQAAAQGRASVSDGCHRRAGRGQADRRAARRKPSAATSAAC